MPILVVADGRIIPNTENSPHNYMFLPGSNDKKTFLRCAISVVRPGGQKDEKGYFKSDLWTVKAFEGTAELINRCWGPGKRIVVSGDMSMSDEYTAPDGTVYPPRPEITARTVCFADSPASNNEEQAPFPNPNTKQTNARPAAAAKAPTQRRSVPWQGQK